MIVEYREDFVLGVGADLIINVCIEGKTTFG